MMRQQVETRTFYRENPITAGHPVKGTSVSMLAVENDGPYLIGDSPVEWDEAAKKNIYHTAFDHYENRPYSEEEADKIFDGKCNKLITDGYVFEVHLDMRHFMNTGQMQFKVEQHKSP